MKPVVGGNVGIALRLEIIERFHPHGHLAFGPNLVEVDLFAGYVPAGHFGLNIEFVVGVGKGHAAILKPVHLVEPGHPHFLIEFELHSWVRDRIGHIDVARKLRHGGRDKRITELKLAAPHLKRRFTIPVGHDQCSRLPTRRRANDLFSGQCQPTPVGKPRAQTRNGFVVLVGGKARILIGHVAKPFLALVLENAPDWFGSLLHGQGHVVGQQARVHGNEAIVGQRHVSVGHAL